MTHKRRAVAPIAALFCAALIEPAFAQPVPYPNAQAASPVAPLIAPSGNQSGTGFFVSPDHPMPVAASASAHTASVTITRPANTTAYTANDVIGHDTNSSGVEFTTMGTSGQDVLITSAELEIDIASLPSGMTSFSLALYSVTPPSALADNAAYDIPSGDRASYLGTISLGTPVDLGSTLYVRTDTFNTRLKLAGTSIFAYLVTAGGFTPGANSEVYKVTLHTTGL